jgi:hypothetical protein
MRVRESAAQIDSLALMLVFLTFLSARPYGLVPCILSALMLAMSLFSIRDQALRNLWLGAWWRSSETQVSKVAAVLNVAIWSVAVSLCTLWGHASEERGIISAAVLIVGFGLSFVISLVDELRARW